MMLHTTSLREIEVHQTRGPVTAIMASGRFPPFRPLLTAAARPNLRNTRYDNLSSCYVFHTINI
jgi:hypothetical protein